MDEKQCKMNYIRHQMVNEDDTCNEEDEDKTNDSETESAEMIDN